MKLTPLPLLLAALLVVDAAAQASSTPPVAPGASTPRAKQSPPAKGAVKAKGVLPDPELLDGSKYEPEKRPLYGMISEIEMGEQEGEQQDRISPNSGPQNPSGAESQQQPQAGGGAQQQPQQAEQQQGGAGGSSQAIAQGGPQGQAVGAQAQSLQGQPQQAGGAQQGGARDMQIGDATLQIQTVQQTPDMVGSEPSKAQQYEKKVPAGQQSNNRNQGVEKGKVIPKGL